MLIGDNGYNLQLLAEGETPEDAVLALERYIRRRDLTPPEDKSLYRIKGKCIDVLYNEELDLFGKLSN